MKELMQACAISFSMYSRLPMPQIPWDEKNRRYVICFFPLIGLLIGALEAAAYFLMEKASMPAAAEAAFLLVIPLLLTGGIHADGFFDTADALSSYRSKEERLSILKDPHVGAFGVIRFAVFLILAFGVLVLYLDRQSGVPTVFFFDIFVLSRILSGISVVFFPCAKREGTLYTFSGEGVKKRVRSVMLTELFICAAVLIYIKPLAGVLILLCNGLLFLYYDRMARRHFGGITGDLAGWFLCLSELVSVAVLAGIAVAI